MKTDIDKIFENYPKPHRWYATAKVVDGYIVSVK